MVFMEHDRGTLLNLVEADVKRGQKLKIRGDEYKVVRTYSAKEDADGPFPRKLVRLIPRGGGAALLDLQPGHGDKVKGDVVISGDSSRPRHYFLTLDKNGKRSGFPVGLTPPQYKRAMSYSESEGVLDPETRERLTDLAEAGAAGRKTRAQGHVWDSEAFCEYIRRHAKVGDKRLVCDNWNQFSKTYDEVIITFVNLPRKAGSQLAGGARAMNNRYQITVEGFAKELGQPPPKGKVKAKTMTASPVFKDAGVQKMRGKTAAPEKVAKSIVDYIAKLAKVEPKLKP